MTQKYGKGSLYAIGPGSKIVHYILQEGFCNSKCRHCYMHFQNQKVQKRNLGIAEQDLQNLISSGYSPHLRGTEILLNPEYLSLFSLIKQNYIQTNGKKLSENPSLFDDLHEVGIQKIYLTYPTEPQNMMDISKDVVDEVIKKSSENGFRTIVNFIVTKDISTRLTGDAAYLEKLCENLIKKGANELRFVRLVPFSDELLGITTSSEEMKKIIEESVRLEHIYQGKLDVTRSGQCGFFDLRRELKEKYFGIKVPSPEESGVMDCHGGKQLFVIDLKNNVYPCLYLMSENDKIGEFTGGNIIITNQEGIPAKLHLEDCPAHTINSERLK